MSNAEKLFAIATEIAERHERFFADASSTFRPRVVWVDQEAGKFNLIVDRNYHVTKKVSREMIIDCRREIVDAWNAAGLKWWKYTQRGVGGRRTWIYTTGFEHMGRMEETTVFARFSGVGK